MIYWITHAESDNIPNGELTTLGYNQAHKVAIWLKQKDIQQIITSTDIYSLYTHNIIKRVLKNVLSKADSRFDVLSRTASKENILQISHSLDTLTENTLIITPATSSVDIIPRLCLNATSLQRVTTPRPTGIILLQRHDIGRYICLAWDLREHLT
jgi:phosphohistidine phosphatase SixA